MYTEFIKSINETVGPMDSRYGYSSKKLTNYFNEKYPYDYFSFFGLQHKDITDDLILSRVTETLLLFENLKESVKLVNKGYFTPQELSFLFQYYNGSVTESKRLYTCESYNTFMADFNEYGQSDFSEDLEEQVQFENKLLSIHPIEFYILRVMIDEYWNHLPSLNSRNTLLDELMGDSDESDE